MLSSIKKSRQKKNDRNRAEADQRWKWEIMLSWTGVRNYDRISYLISKDQIVCANIMGVNITLN